MDAEDALCCVHPGCVAVAVNKVSLPNHTHQVPRSPNTSSVGSPSFVKISTIIKNKICSINSLPVPLLPHVEQHMDR